MVQDARLAPGPLLSRLSVVGFRNLGDQTIEPGRETNLFLGSNGQGKTSVLEATYLLATGRSFRRATGQQMIRFGGQKLRISGTVTLPHGQIEVEVGMGPSGGRQLTVAGKPVRLMDLVALLPTVAVTAERMEIVRGGPEERRGFLDRGLLLEIPRLFELLRQVERIHRQKATLLGSKETLRHKRDELAAWNRTLADLAVRLRSRRRLYAAEIEVLARGLVGALGRPEGQVSLRYCPSPEGPDEAGALREALDAVSEQELASGRVKLGPSRDDLEILVAGRVARQYASAGEQKALVLALKLAKIERARRVTGSCPLLLLDDVDAELDEGVFSRFLERIPREAQVLATSAKPEWVEAALRAGSAEGGSRGFTVVGGEIRPRYSIGAAPRAVAGGTP